MLILAAGPWEAAIDPDRGASFARLTHDGREIIRSAPPGADPSRGFHGGFWMAPWTNRLDAGRIAVDGVVHHMPITRPEENTALHGFVRDLPWQVARAGPRALALSCAVAHPPFTCRFSLDIGLTEAGLSIAAALTNTGAAPTPMGFGWHPFFARPKGTRLSFRAGTVFGRDSRNLVMGPRPTAGFEGADRTLDSLDTHFAGWDGTATVTHPGGVSWRMTATGAWRGNLQVYAPPGTGVFCVEPVTHAPDAVNRPAAAAHGPMHVLAPGETLSAALRLEA